MDSPTNPCGVAIASKKASCLVSLGSQSGLPPRSAVSLCASPQTLQASVVSTFSWVSALTAQWRAFTCCVSRGVTGLCFLHPRDGLETGERRGTKSCFSGPSQKSLQLFPDTWTLNTQGQLRAQAFPEDKGRWRPIPILRAGFVKATPLHRPGEVPSQQRWPPAFVSDPLHDRTALAPRRERLAEQHDQRQTLRRWSCGFSDGNVILSLRPNVRLSWNKGDCL